MRRCSLHLYDSQCNRLRRHYAVMLSCLDSRVAQVVQELKTQELYENSVLIYSSDNGGQPLSGGSNWTLRGGKGTYWEGGIRTVGIEERYSKQSTDSCLWLVSYFIGACWSAAVPPWPWWSWCLGKHQWRSSLSSHWNSFQHWPSF